MHPTPPPEPDWTESRITRRGLLRGAAAAGLALGSASFLAACGGGGGNEASGGAAATGATTAEAGQPRRGGRLRVGHVGGGKAEGFNPARGSSFIDASRNYNLYDPLTRVNPDFS